MSHKKESKEDFFYSKIAQLGNKKIIAGRYEFDEHKEASILSDILLKIDVKPTQEILDIGCGASNLTHLLLQYFSNLDCQITINDINEIIEVLEKDFLVPSGLKNVTKYKGFFPYDFKIENKLFDRILLYSVLHYSSTPEILVEEAVKLLNTNGILLLGDLPNISKKGKFLTSNKGKKFEANYKNVNIENLPHYNDHFDFVSQMKNDKNYYSLIDDSFIYEIYRKYTHLGYDVYILPQSDNLPFSYTRQDIIIRKYD